MLVRRGAAGGGAAAAGGGGIAVAAAGGGAGESSGSGHLGDDDEYEYGYDDDLMFVGCGGKGRTGGDTGPGVVALAIRLVGVILLG